VSTLLRAVPAYFHPADRPDEWRLLHEASAATTAMVVANVMNGPGHERTQIWAGAFAGVRANGVDLVGYVDTGYFGTTGLATRLGSTSSADWIAQIQQDVADWFELYGLEINGIFYDQIATRCGSRRAIIDLRAACSMLGDDVHRRDPAGVTVMNPGTAVPEHLLEAADVWVTFEGPYERYIDLDACHDIVGHRTRRAHRVWHIVHGAETTEHHDEVAMLANARGADHLYVTAGTGPNTYGSLDARWTRSAGLRGAACAAHQRQPARPARASTTQPWRPRPSQPRRLAVTGVDHSSVQLAWDVPSRWRRSARADVELEVLVDGMVMARLPPEASAVTIGSLHAGSCYVISIRSARRGGLQSVSSEPVTVALPTLPDPGLTITAPSGTWRDRMFVASAEFLVPFAFHRLFISTGIASTPSWTTGSSPQIEAHWLIENDQLFAYAGSGTDWTWRSCGPVPRQQHGRCHSWWLDPHRIGHPYAVDIVFQAEGYAPPAHSEVVHGTRSSTR